MRKEANYPSGIWGFAMRILAYDEAERGGRVARTAFKLFEKRKEQNLPGSAEEDWAKAKEIVGRRIALEVERRMLA